MSKRPDKAPAEDAPAAPAQAPEPAQKPAQKPATGGSFVRQPDGTLKRVAHTKEA